MTGQCATCRHRVGDAAYVESAVGGLTVFGSGFGASIGDSRICRLHDCLVSTTDTCGAFEARQVPQCIPS
jgi:hypothetical protein